MIKHLLLFQLFWSVISTSAFAITNPGPDGVRFNQIEIYRAEKTLEKQLRDKQLRDKQLQDKSLSTEEIRELEGLQTILKTGKRAVLWFGKVNSSRTPETRMDLNKKGNSKGMPITEPNKTNSTILIDRYNTILKEISPSIASVVTSTSDLPENAPVSDEEFVAGIRRLDVVYQHAIRWIGAKDALSWYLFRSLWDIRGYYFLKQIPDLTEKLTQFQTLPEAERKTLSEWLYGLCHNGDFDDDDCKDELTKAITKGRLVDYYNRFNKYGEKQYNSFFSIPAIRPEVFWNEDRTVLHSPFLSPEKPDVQKWLALNVEEEWKSVWKEENFQLKLDFVERSKKSIPHIEFKSGVTAHVNEIAGDTITLNGDYSIENYDMKWTIRHEYGHVLGLVDCYLEFYDVNERAMIYYELDTTNLMCSRAGKFQPLHITGLKNAYK